MTRVTHLGVGARAIAPVDVDLIRHLSERAHAERAPGQTLQSKMNELRREFEFAVPSHNLAPHCAGGAAIRG